MDITKKLETLAAAHGGSEASQTITEAQDEIFKLRGLLDQARRERDEALRLAHQATRRALLPRVVSDAEVILTVKDRTP